jgi:hypothetical protein
VTGEFSAQIHADISGDWIVWEDHRLGAAQIFGIQLPRLRPLPDVRVKEGSALRLPIRAIHGGGASLHLTLEVVGDLDAEALGMELVDSGQGRGMLRWRPAFDQAGEYVITIAAAAEGGLVTRQSIRLEVRQANARPRVVIESPGAVAVGSDAVLDACGSDDADGDALSFIWEALPLYHGQYRRRGAGAQVIGTDCRLELAAVDHISLRRFRLRISDGRVEVRRRVAVAWLPARWLQWWLIVRPVAH